MNYGYTVFFNLFTSFNVLCWNKRLANAGTAISGDSQVLSLSAIRNNGQTPIQGAEFPPDEWKLQRLSDHAAVYTCIKNECGFDVIFSQFPDSSGRSPRLCRKNARVSVSQNSIIIPFNCTADVT